MTVRVLLPFEDGYDEVRAAHEWPAAIALPRTRDELAEAAAIAAVSGLRLSAGASPRRRPLHDVLLVRSPRPPREP